MNDEVSCHQHQETADVHHHNSKDQLYLQLDNQDPHQSSSSDEDSQQIERPSTLKFLAAREIFQDSTVRAVKRLPYTPDPGTICTLVICCDAPKTGCIGTILLQTYEAQVRKREGN